MHRSSWEDLDALFVALRLVLRVYRRLIWTLVISWWMPAGRLVIDRMDRYSYAFHEEQDMAIWDYSQDSDKWRVFKHNNFNYNTLTIDDQLQVTQVGKVGHV